MSKKYATLNCFNEMLQFHIYRYVVLVSGLDLGSKHSEPMMVQLFVDLVVGSLGNNTQLQQMASVVRIIIAGNSLSAETRDSDNASKV